MVERLGGLDVAVVAEQLRRRVPGGIGTYARGLLAGLEALMTSGEADLSDLTVLASPPVHSGQDDVAALGARLECLGLPWSRPLAGLARSSRQPRLQALPGAVLTRLWDAGWGKTGTGHDVVHSVSMAIPPTGEVPLTAMIHDVAWRANPEAFPPRGLAWHEAALRRVSRRAAAVIVPSHDTAVALEAAAGELEAARIEVIPHGSDHLLAPDRAGARRLLARHGVAAGYIVSVSTLEPRKNLTRLIAAFASIRADLTDEYSLVVVGPTGWGEMPSAPAGVVLTGPVSGELLSGLYAEATLAAYVPLQEGYGLPAMEAMRTGTAVLASTGVPSVAELGTGCARVVDPTSTNDIALAMADLLEDPAARAEIVGAATKSVSANTWAASAARHLAVWREVAR